ncbi:MAG: radical SAM/SPASM domain-containing protein [Verrucomicrobiota bacterium]|nr:radical SAM/SPASM domain-containing protein [Verrucomicrobiota bacterium]
MHQPYSPSKEIRPSLQSRIVCRAVGALYDTSLRDFPRVVRIETTNACNAKCIICPHPVMTRPAKVMPPGLYNRIIDECGANKCREVHLHNFGEPLLDKHLEDKVRYAKQKGIAKVKIFSNGSITTETRAIGLMEAGLDEMKISFDGSTKEEFERIRAPLKFDVVVENILTLVRLRNERKSSLRISINCVSTSDKSKTMELLEKSVDSFSFGKIHNWGDGDFTEIDSRTRKPCSRVWRTFTVLVNGDVALCCLDYDGKKLLGRVDDKTTIKQIWSNPAYLEVRDLHRKAKMHHIDLCAKCSKSYV